MNRTGIGSRISRLERTAGGTPVEQLTDEQLDALIDDINSRWVSGERFDHETERRLEQFGMIDADGQRRPLQFGRLRGMIEQA